MKSYQQINKVQFLPAICQYGRVQSLPIFLIFLSGYRYLSDDGTDQRGILHDGTYWPQTGLLTFWGPGSVPQGIPQILNFGHLTGNIGGKSTLDLCYASPEEIPE